MVKVYDPNANLRKMQNFLILSLFYGSIVFIILYISLYISIIAIEGYDKLLTLIKTQFPEQLIVAYKTAVYYGTLVYSNIGIISLESYNFFIPKAIVCMLLLPILIFLLLLYKFHLLL